MSDPKPLLLGHVTVPSGTVVLIDGGMLGMWSHDRPPLLDEDEWGAEMVALANGAVDLVARGRDAIESVRLFDLASARPPYVFDIPEAAVSLLQRDFAALSETHRLEARLEPTPQRVPHRHRAAVLLEATPGIVEVPFHGMWAVACNGIPTDRELPIFGRRMPAGSGHDGRWESVWLQVSPSAEARSEPAASVVVDRARLMFADANALGDWKQDEPLDGLVDLVFWGRDAAAAARESGAAPLRLPGEEDVFGWKDVAGHEVVVDAHQRLEALRQKGLKFAVDFRPHSHAHQLMAQVRSSETGSGMVELAGAAVCGFATTWGDGVFEVHRGLAADGTLVRLSIEMGTPQRLALMGGLEQRWRNGE